MSIWNFFRRKPLLDKYGNAPEPPTPEPTVCENGDVLSHVVLRYLSKVLRDMNKYNTEKLTIADCDKQEGEISRLRVWAQTLDDERIRNEYTRWLNYYQRGVREVREELRIGRAETTARFYRRDTAALFKAVDACQASGRIPEPPKS